MDIRAHPNATDRSELQPRGAQVWGFSPVASLTETCLKSVAALVVLLGTTWAAYLLTNREIQRQTLPSKLQLGWFYAEGSCNAVRSFQRSYAFRLAEETTVAIQAQGIEFFSDIEREDNGAVRTLFSGDWKPTPLPPLLLADGSLALHCGRDGSWFWPPGIQEALMRPGSFYRHSGAGGIFIIPQLRLVVGSSG